MNFAFSAGRYQTTRSGLSIRKADRNRSRSPKHCSKPKYKPMKSKTMILCVALVSLRLADAQTNEPANDWKPATTNQGGKEYPQVNSEGRVKFRVVAPEAKSVGCTF